MDVGLGREFAVRQEQRCDGLFRPCADGCGERRIRKVERVANAFEVDAVTGVRQFDFTPCSLVTVENPQLAHTAVVVVAEQSGIALVDPAIAGVQRCGDEPVRVREMDFGERATVLDQKLRMEFLIVNIDQVHVTAVVRRSIPGQDGQISRRREVEPGVG